MTATRWAMTGRQAAAPRVAAGEGALRGCGVRVRVVAVSSLYYLVNLCQVCGPAPSDRARPSAIVVLGAAQYDGRPSPLLAARLDHVVELWNQGWPRW